MSHFNKQAISLHHYTREYKQESFKDNTKADPEKVKTRRDLEARLEAKHIREMDPLDEQWEELYS